MQRSAILISYILIAVELARSSDLAEIGNVASTSNESLRKLQSSIYKSLEFAVEPGTSHSADFSIGAIEAYPVVAIAGMPITEVKLTGNQPLTFPAGVQNGRIRLVPGTMTQADADAGRCETDWLLDTHTALKGGSGDPGDLINGEIVWAVFGAAEAGMSMDHRRRSALRVGGEFKFCYRAQSSWDIGAVLVPSQYSRMEVYGAVMYDGYELMHEKRHYCFAGGIPGTNCKVQLAGVTGNTTAGGEWPRHYRLTWARTVGFQDTCGTEIALSVLGVGSASAPFILGGLSGLVFDLGYTIDNKQRWKFWLCYCPGLNADGQGQACQDKGDFLQEVGLLIIFVAEQTVATVVPVTRFDITIYCGTVEGCAANEDNRIKILDPSSWDATLNINNRPIWDPTSGCRTTLQSTKFVAPPNCVAIAECAALLNGGNNADRKLFLDMKMGNTVVVGLTATKRYDICFCNEDCRVGSNWFKVGDFTVAKAQTLPVEDTHLGSDSGTPGLQVVNTPGLVRLNTVSASDPDPVGSYITNSLASKLSQIKLLPENTLDSVSDLDCADGIPPPVFTNHGCSVWYQCYPFGWKDESTQVVTFNALYFHGGVLGKAFQDDPLVQDTSKTIMQVSTPGIFAVCYCQDSCADQTSWAKLTRLEIRGALGGQTWLYQTMIPFNLRVSGVGLKDSNRIKIITASERCDGATKNWHQLHINHQYHEYFQANILKSSSDLWQFAGPAGANGNHIVEILDWFDLGSQFRFATDATRVGIYTNLMKAGDVLVLSNLTIDRTGEFPYIYPATEEQVEIMTVPWGHRLLDQVSGDNSGTLFSTAAKLRHADGTVPTWSSTLRAAWKRTSEASYENIESVEARKGLKVCWSDNSTENANFVTEAGILDLEDAPLMDFTTANLVATQAGAVAPMVIVFRTSVGSGTRYREAINEMTLRILFQDPHIDPRAANPGGDELFHDPDHNDISVADQVVCGKLFKELWSSHVNGFPVPKGCYYQQPIKAYTIVFSRKNGLAPSTEYQIVMNVQTTLADPSDPTYWQRQPAVRVWSLDDIILRREFAVEVGLGFLRPWAYGFPLSPASGDSAQLAADGFKIHSSADASWPSSDRRAVDLSLPADLNTLSFELNCAGGRIERGQVLRIIFWPLTQWRLDSECKASCNFVNGTDECGNMQCDIKTICAHDGAQRNMAQVVAPNSVEGNVTKLRIAITDLKLPQGGLFPSHSSAELSNVASLYPSYALSSGRLIYVPPQLTFGGIIRNSVGDGNSRPFQGDLGNDLYARIVIGATLHSQPSSERVASLTLHLPTEYTCVSAGVVPENLQVFGNDAPQGRGDLADNQTVFYAVGSWSYSANMCHYKILPLGSITAGSSMYIKLIVNNPLDALPRANPLNKWYVSLHSYGEEDSLCMANCSPVANLYSTPLLPFVSNTGSFLENVAVQGKLLSSASPLILTPGSLTNKVYIFFFTQQGAGQRAQIRVLGPRSEPYDFEKQCTPGLLPERYYVDVSPAQSTFPLPGMEREIACQGMQSSIRPAKYYGAFLQLSGRLRAQRNYGFSLQIGNPTIYDLSQKVEWQIITYTSAGAEIDGSYHTVPHNPRVAIYESFGLYEYQPSNRDLATKFVSSLHPILPTSASGGTSWFSMGGVEFPADTSCQLRLILPGGYQFEYLAREFLYRPADVLQLLPSSGYLDDGTPLVDATLPVGFVAMPVVEPLNEVSWPEPGNFMAGMRYGFAAKVRVPDYPNTGSINAVYLECGFDETGMVNRPLAAVVEVPHVAALVDAAVSYTTLVKGASNVLRFQVRTTTAIRNSGALVIDGPAGFLAETFCDVSATSQVINDRLVSLRSQYLNYEFLDRQQQIAEASFGINSEQYLEAAAKSSVALDALKLEAKAAWEQRISNNALPIDIGCRFESGVDARQSVRFIFQLGFPKMDLDMRIASFVRRYFGTELFLPGQNLESWLPVGLYRFDVPTTNPDIVYTNEKVEQEIVSQEGDASTDAAAQASKYCGYEMCWEFESYKAPYSEFVPADRGAVAKGFAVMDLMPDAALAELTHEQRLRTLRNDRPQASNQLIFIFSLGRVLPAGVGKLPPVEQNLVIKGPEEFAFAEDCIVVTARDAVFGGPQLWPTHLSSIDGDNSSTATCEGLQNIATITISSASDGLQPGILYAFRIDVLENPITTPLWNYWTIVFHGHKARRNDARHSESSNMFPGFEQWTFSSGRVIPTTTERSTGIKMAGVVFNGNIVLSSVTTLFRPYNSIVAPGGVLGLTAPDTFDWLNVGFWNASGTSQTSIGRDARCDAVLRAKPANLSRAARVVEEYGELSVPLWDTLQTRCTISPLFKNFMIIEIIGSVGLVHGEEYAIVATVNNPSVEISTPGDFELVSKQPTPELSAIGTTSASRNTSILVDYDDLEELDEAKLPGFQITKTVNSLVVAPLDGTIARGGTILDTRVSVDFSEFVFPNDVIRFTAPPTFKLKAIVSGGSFYASISRKCKRVINRSKPGVYPEQQLKCFAGLICILNIWGVKLGADSKVQLNSLTRSCGELPGRDHETRQTQAEISDSSIQKSYTLGLNMVVGKYRVCYCHGDGSCNDFANYCQEVGNLTVADFCADVVCPGNTTSCETRCNPRTGSCIPPSGLPMLRVDGASCFLTDGELGTCRAGVCSNARQLEIFTEKMVVRRQQETSVVPLSCVFDQFQCTERTLSWTVGHQGYPRAETLHVDVTILLPEISPDADNLFMIEHVRANNVRSSRIIPAYTIQPGFRAASVSLLGPLLAGGALSTIEIYVLPVSPASSLWIRAKEPIGFDFKHAKLLTVGRIISALDDKIEVATIFDALEPVYVRFEDVHLPPQGGQGYFDILAFNGSDLRDSSRNVEAFRTPAHIDISEAMLLNEYKRDTTGQFEIEATFGNRLGSWAQLSVNLRFSADLPANQRLRIAAHSWKFSPASATIEEFRRSGIPVSLNFTLTQHGQVQSDGSADLLDVVVQSPLGSQTYYRYVLTIDVFAPEPNDCICWTQGLCRLCNSNWTFELLDSGELPLATNDGLFFGFPLVSEIQWSVFTPRAPPEAFLNVTLRFRQVGAVHSTMLIATAPKGYVFPYKCLSSSTEASVDLPEFTSCTGRLNIAILGLDDAGLYRPTTVTLLVTTPRKAPTENRWFLEGRQANGNVQVGWGVTTGLISETLRSASVEYGNFQMLQTYFLVRLVADIDVQDGGAIIVLPPGGYTLHCSNMIIFNVPDSAHPNYRTSCVELREGIRLEFAHATLRAAMEYSFAVDGVTGSRSGNDDTFTIQVLDQLDRIVEATYDIPASELRFFGDVVQPFLLWYDTPAAGGVVWATVGIMLPLRAREGLYGIRIELPDGVEHRVTTTARDHSRDGASFVARMIAPRMNPPGTFSDYLEWTQRDVTAGGGTSVAFFNSSSSEIPLEPDARRWLDLGRADQLELRFQNWRPFPASEMLVRFPLILPNTMPLINVWRIALVFVGISGQYGQGNAQDFEVSFVVPGFQFGAVSSRDLENHAQHLFEDAGTNYNTFSAAWVANKVQQGSTFCSTVLLLWVSQILAKLS